MTAGELAVVALADGPLPFPMRVEGDRIGGEGTTVYQYVLPLDRSEVSPPVSQPALAPPATRPAATGPAL